MTLVFPELSGLLLAYLLTFTRTGAMIMLMPAIGNAGVPPRVRLAFALAVSAALVPVVAGHYPTEAPHTMLLGLLIAREATIGVLIGGIARLIMSALETAGFLIATQTGLAFSQTFDPGQGVQSAIVGAFLSLLGTLMVFETGLHHMMIGAIEGSYVLLPPGGAIPVGDLAQLALTIFSAAFTLGLQLAAPFFVFGLVIYVTLGVLSRLMPQLQVFFMAMPLNIMVGFVILMLLLGTIMTTFLNFFAQHMSQLAG